MSSRKRGTGLMLKPRLLELPMPAYQKVRREFGLLPKKGPSRWRDIMRDEIADLHFQEALLICNLTGCTIQELSDPNVSLRDTYDRMRKKEEEEDIARHFGISA